jgi:hypothetical protein
LNNKIQGGITGESKLCNINVANGTCIFDEVKCIGGTHASVLFKYEEFKNILHPQYHGQNYEIQSRVFFLTLLILFRSSNAFQCDVKLKMNNDFVTIPSATIRV